MLELLVLKMCKKEIVTVSRKFSPTYFSFSNKIYLLLYRYQTEDGQKREEKGSLVNPNTKDEGLEVVGSYSYTKDDKTYIVTYTAGVNGYRPVTKIIQNKPKGY